MRSLSSHLNEETVRELKEKLRRGEFAGITLEDAMNFFLTDGVIPRSELPARAFLDLEDWIRSTASRPAAPTASYTTTELKNKTGEVLDQALQGKIVKLTRHGRTIAEIRRIT